MNHYGELVQAGAAMMDGRFMSGSFTTLAAGPPRLANVGGSTLFGGAISSRSKVGDQIAMPLGLVQSWSLGQNMSLARFFEIGSRRSVFIPGHTVGQLSLSRPMYHGGSLLRLLMSYYADLLGPTIIPSMFQNIGAATVDNPHDVQVPPGYENVFLNLFSDLFHQPHGMLMVMQDNNEDLIAANYFEACYIPNHSVSFDAQGTVIMENAALQYERIVPVAVRSLGLIT